MPPTLKRIIQQNKMIDVRELRIGNTIFAKWLNELVEVEEITYMDNTNPAKKELGEYAINEVSIEQYEGVEITEEILLERGFKKGEVTIKTFGEPEPCYWLGWYFVLIRPDQNTFFGEKYLGGKMNPDGNFDRLIKTIKVVWRLHEIENLYTSLSDKILIKTK